MTRVMFVCLGNICRSPMAEFIFSKMLKDTGMDALIYAESAGTSGEEAGNPVYPSAAAELKKHGIFCAGKRARRLQKSDFSAYDLFVCMDKGNLRAMNRLFGTDEKQFLLLSFAGRADDVADPWYTRDFSAAYRDIEEGCRGLLAYLRENADGE